eukprot:snap_masked-scaffold_7-processed-gene-2.49-mRNA-1 protein AED:1.00 eAED:1.00 QI:0/-1/0/0/-1/1/1/0/91
MCRMEFYSRGLVIKQSVICSGSEVANSTEAGNLCDIVTYIDSGPSFCVSVIATIVLLDPQFFGVLKDLPFDQLSGKVDTLQAQLMKTMLQN